MRTVRLLTWHSHYLYQVSYFIFQCQCSLQTCTKTKTLQSVTLMFGAYQDKQCRHLESMLYFTAWNRKESVYQRPSTLTSSLPHMALANLYWVANFSWMASSISMYRRYGWVLFSCNCLNTSRDMVSPFCTLWLVDAPINANRRFCGKPNPFSPASQWRPSRGPRGCTAKRN